MHRLFTRSLTLLVAIVALLAPLALNSTAALAAPSRPAISTGIKLLARTPDGAPLARASVSITPLNLSGTTDRTGTLLLDDLSVREKIKVNVTVKAQGYRAWVLRNATLYPNDTLEINAPLSDSTTAQETPEVIDVQPHRMESGAPQTLGSVSAMPDVGTQATHTTPPTTIRVQRVSLGRVDTVDFKTYVKHVLPNEWIPSWHSESLKAGSLPVKIYGWYWTINAKYPGSGYDVKDTTSDQVYNPNVSYASTNAAVDATWNYKITRNGLIFQAHYCAGSYNGSRTSGQCSEKHGWTVGTYLSQWGSKYLADNGRTWQSMMTFYYDNVAVGTIGGGGTLPMPAWPTLRNGNTGDKVKAAQHLLRHRGHAITADGVFGAGTEAAVRSFQSANGLTADGIIGPNTFLKLIATVRLGDNNEAVRGEQVLLGITADGIFGSGTESSVKSLQTQFGLTADGIVGPQTWQASFGK